LYLDQVTIRATVETKRNIAIDVKGKQIGAGAKHDKKDEPVAADYRTQRVSLNPILITRKEDNHATQSVEILLRDLSKYDELMEI
jgi:hypothetical protein